MDNLVWNVNEKILSSALTFEVIQFIFAEVCLTSIDIGTDIYQAYEYYVIGETLWCIATVVLIFLPCILSLIVEHILPCVFRREARMDDSQLLAKLNRFPRFLRHFPLIQPFVNIGYAFILYSTQKKISKELIEFKDISKPERIKEISKDPERLQEEREKVLKKAEEIDDIKQKYSSLWGHYQEMKLFEAFGESAPQFVLQVAIILETGQISTAQKVTIWTSFFMFTRAATNIYLLFPTKHKVVRSKTWKDLVIVFITQCVFVFSRLLSSSICCLYLKMYIFFALAIYIAVSLFILKKEMKTDPRKTLLGIITNIFGPSIVHDEHSKFLFKSSMLATVFHMHCLIVIFMPIFAGVRLDIGEHMKWSEDSVWYERVVFGVTEVLLILNIPFTVFLNEYLDPVYRLLVFAKLRLCGDNWNFDHERMLIPVKEFVKTPVTGTLSNWDLEVGRTSDQSLLYWAVREGSPYLVDKLLNQAFAEITSDVWTEACRQGRSRIINQLVERAKRVHSERNQLIDVGNGFDALFNESNKEVRNMMVKNNALGAYLRKLYLEVYSEEFVHFPNNSLRRETEESYTNADNALYKLQSKSNMTAQEGFLVSYCLKAPESCHMWASKMKKDIEHANVQNVELKIRYPIIAKAIPVFYAIIEDDFDRFKFFINTMSIHVVIRAHDDSGLTCLHLAAALNRIEVFKYFIENTDDINPTTTEGGITPLNVAVKHGNDDLAKMIGTALHSKMTYGRTLSHALARKGDYLPFKCWSEDLRDKNPKDNKGVTPLHIAAEENHGNIVTFLLRNCDDKNPADDLGITPLHWSARKDNTEVYKIIAQHVKDKNPKDFNGETPLHIAAKNDNFDLVDYLIKEVKDKNPRDKNEKTPLHYIAENGNAEMFKLIGDQVEDVNHRSNDNETPLQLAQKENHAEILAYLASRL